jgi:hypothetical protein
MNEFECLVIAQQEVFWAEVVYEVEVQWVLSDLQIVYLAAVI